MIDLYRFYNAIDDLLYVGISLSAAQRASSHKRSKGWWPEVVLMAVEHLDTDDYAEAERIEREAIIAERPRYNVTHNPEPQPSPAPPKRLHRTATPDPIRRTLMQAARFGLKMSEEDLRSSGGKQRRGFRCMHETCFGRCKKNATRIEQSRRGPLALCPGHDVASAEREWERRFDRPSRQATPTLVAGHPTSRHLDREAHRWFDALVRGEVTSDQYWSRIMELRSEAALEAQVDAALNRVGHA
jgi:hypothetical protein